MILSNSAIQRALDEGRLVIDPEPAPRKPTPGQDSPYQTSSVDLRLGDEIAWMKEGLALSMDLRLGKFTSLFRRELGEEKDPRRAALRPEPWPIRAGQDP